MQNVFIILYSLGVSALLETECHCAASADIEHTN